MAGRPSTQKGSNSLRKGNRWNLEIALGGLGVPDVVLLQHKNLIPTQGSRTPQDPRKDPFQDCSRVPSQRPRYSHNNTAAAGDLQKGLQNLGQIKTIETTKVVGLVDGGF